MTLTMTRFDPALLRQLRSQLNLSQEKFAAQLGVSFKTINRWENGHSTPSPMALKLLSHLLTQMEASGHPFVPSNAGENN